jgi:predicted ATPase
MSGFQLLSVHGFRRLDVDIDFTDRPLCVLIGANGSGKTSLLDVFSLLAAAAQGKLREKINNLSGISSILTQGKAERLSIGVSTANGEDGGDLRYELVLLPRRNSYTVEYESLQKITAGQPDFVYLDSESGELRYYDSGTGGLLKPAWMSDPSETALSQVPKDLTVSEHFRRQLANSVYYHTLDVGPRSPVRLPQPIRPASLPGANGEDLVTCLYEMRETDFDRFDTIQDALRAAFPGFEELKLPAAAAGTLAMLWRDRNFPNGFYTYQLAEGAIRFLWLATLLQCAALPAVTLLDEPEVSLHPELLGLLADLLREASQRSQIVVATHSDRFVRFLKPREVLVADLAEDGLTSLKWADSLNLDKWLDEYTLDQVGSMGRLGGRACESF